MRLFKIWIFALNSYGFPGNKERAVFRTTANFRSLLSSEEAASNCTSQTMSKLYCLFLLYAVKLLFLERLSLKYYSIFVITSIQQVQIICTSLLRPQRETQLVSLIIGKIADISASPNASRDREIRDFTHAIVTLIVVNISFEKATRYYI